MAFLERYPGDDRNQIAPPQELGGGVEPFPARSPYFSYDANTQMQPFPTETLAGGLRALGGGVMDFGNTILSLPGILGQGIKESLDVIKGSREQLGEIKKPKKDLSDENIVAQYAQYGDTPEFWDAIGLGASQNGITPTSKLPPIIGQFWDNISPERRAFIGQQGDVMKRLERMSPILNLLAQAPKTPGGFERMGVPGVQPLTEQQPYAPEYMPLGIPERLHGAQMLDVQAKQGAPIPFDQVQAAQQLAGGDTLLQPPSHLQQQLVGPVITAASQRGQHMLSPDQQRSELKTMLASGLVTQEQYDNMLPTLTMPMPVTSFKGLIGEATTPQKTPRTTSTTRLVNGWPHKILVDSATGKDVKDLGPEAPTIENYLSEEGLPDELLKVGMNPYDTAQKASSGNKLAQVAIENAIDRLDKRRELRNAAATKAEIMARPLDPVDRNAITLMTNFVRKVDHLTKDFTPEQTKSYVGLMDKPLNELKQIMKNDATFADWNATLGYVQRQFFSDDLAGAALTATELNVLKQSIAHGKELSTSDFLAKLRISRNDANDLIESRISLATQSRSAVRDARKAAKQAVDDAMKGK